jgi:2-polyprenyl-6-hydroxyphenyl methylase/3-demethylubiquinone-9 3-methyltransferase
MIIASAPAMGTAYDVDHWSRRAGSDAGLNRYLADNGVPYNAAKVALLERLVGDVHGMRMLDYGGGAGYFGLRCARRGANLTLVDPAPAALDLARRLAATWGLEAPTTIESSTVPDFDQQFDVVVLKDVIEHVQDDAGLLRRIADLQPAGGRLLLSTHNQWSLNYLIEGAYERWWCGNKDWLGWDPTHVRFYSPRTLRALLRNAGYGNIRWASVYIVPYNIGSWFTLLKKDLTWPALSNVDLALGRVWPFSVMGWNVLLCAERLGR